MELTTIWFLLVAVLFTGYFILEGFDFGVGMLLPVLGRDDRERRVMINTIGPVWDGNEVWLITAGGAMFAAFPEWYATLFSGFYLPLLLILLALIARGVAFEYRHKRPEASWKRRWDAAIFFGSLVPAVLWGVAFANILRGVPLDVDHEYVGGLLNLLNPYALLGGATTAALFLTHGAVFIALKTVGDIRDRAAALAVRLGVAAAVLAVAFLSWTLTIRSSAAAVVLAVGAALALLGGLAAAAVRREGWAFTGTAVAIALAVATLFAALFPNVLPSTLDPAGTLTATNAASTPYTLTIMTWVAVFFTPIVLAYQGWTYWVFRKRIGVAHIPQH
ncbi:cytochrome bd-I ubiquinol oxidase subunit 2 apoprotein [Micromonospora phaseoli]|uniref:Cytochrome bd-I ubiquinol oxidase subunit 2 apoprotein n=1 Tax=Micromonospora phaseoli TaxID=1144548 RepID=A0A1H6U5X5_9ACTN|nr:cytochrome d ubiquinol oxidase subunit II [Micromonospora phaseoli]PZV98825.1 cytochrome bd-I ubiquinol oxidase subunit 2 apoprotein [Micromonospora phaseoli]GIJ76424.1 cytochrome c oxidase assembly protein [Micromonospora phaseoli]SEI85954.1 cytochrome bd-I ubiquinol oxidase subunit 2 apoprotein [Micromonospora phaseoli]